MRTSPPDRAALRRLLEQIPTDSDFDGFCLDYFPDAHRRFSSDMDRVAKINLLLQLVPDLTVIASRLRERFPALSRSTPATSSRLWIVAALVGIGVLGLAGYCAKGLLGPPSGMPSAIRSVTQDGAVDAGRVPTLDAAASQPQGGTVVDHAGDIDAKGSVRIGAPAGGQSTEVKTRGQIRAGGDVQIGVTAPASPVRK